MWGGNTPANEPKKRSLLKIFVEENGEQRRTIIVDAQGKEHVISLDNIESLSAIAAHLDFDELKGEAVKCKKGLVDAQNTTHAVEEILENAVQLQQLLFSLNKDAGNVSDVRQHLLSTSWVSTKESVKELARNILVLVDARFALARQIATLCKELAEMGDKFPALTTFRSVLTRCLFMDTKVNRGAFAYHLYSLGFFDHKTLVRYAKSGYTDNRNRRTGFGACETPPWGKFWFWFIPELVEQFPALGQYNTWDVSTAKWVELERFAKYKDSDWQLYKNLRDKQSTSHRCEEAIRNNDALVLAKLLSEHGNYNCVVPYSLFANHGSMSVLECCAFYGSVACLRFLLMNEAAVTKECKRYAIIGGNAEIIKIINEQPDQTKQGETDASSAWGSSSGFGGFTTRIESNLSLAIKYHHDDVAVYELEKCPDKERAEPFRTAVSVNNVCVLLSMLQSGIPYGCQIPSELSTCSQNGYASLLKALLVYHRKVGAAASTVSQSDIEGGSIDCIDALVKIGYEFPASSTCIAAAADSGNLDTVKYVMQHCGCSIQSNVLAAIILTAVKYGYFDIVDFLLEVYNDVTSTLNAACVHNEADLAQRMLSLEQQKCPSFLAGLIVLSVENGSADALALVIKEYPNFSVSAAIYRSLSAAIRNGYRDVVDMVMKHMNADDRDEYGIELARTAMTCNQSLIAESIIRKLSNVDGLLYTAVANRQIYLVELLLQIDKSPRVVNYRTEIGTALNHAVANNSVKIVRMLLDVPGIDVLAYGKSQGTPLYSVTMRMISEEEKSYCITILKMLITFYKEHGLIESRYFEVHQAFQELVKVWIGNKYPESITQVIVYLLETIPEFAYQGGINLLLPAARNGSVVIIKRILEIVTTQCLPTATGVIRAEVASLYNQALSFEKGRNERREINLAKAAELYKLAAEQGHSKAQCNYGCMLIDGKVPGGTSDEAVRYFKMSADRGDCTGMCNYGTCLETGKGIAKNLAEAIKYYKWAAAGGDISAQINLDRLKVAKSDTRIPTFNVNEYNEVGTALMNAIASKHDEIANMLIDVESTDLNFTTGDGESALSLAIAGKNYKLVERIASDRRFVYESRHAKILIAAVNTQNTAVCKMIFNIPNVSVNDMTNAKQTALGIAIEQNSSEIIDLILDHPSFPKCLRPVMPLILKCTARGDRLLLHKLLTNAKLDVNILIDNMTLLEHAIGTPSPMCIEYIVTNPTYDPVANNIAKCFRDAMNCGKYDAASKLLLSDGIDINQVLDSGFTPLILCAIAARGSVSLTNAILGYKNLDVNIQDANGETALMHAIRKGKMPLVTQLLRKSECRLDLKNRSGMSAFDIWQSTRPGDAPWPSGKEDLRSWMLNKLQPPKHTNTTFGSSPGWCPGGRFGSSARKPSKGWCSSQSGWGSKK